jgi:origin recognition complex subunit 2
MKRRRAGELVDGVEGFDPITRDADRAARPGADPNSDIEDEPMEEEEEDDDEPMEADDDDDDDDEPMETEEPNPPPKRRPGRPKGTKNRAPSPPSIHLAPHERYFWDNRPGASKTSNNTLPAGLLLNHDDFLAQRAAFVDPHARELRFLMDLHRSSFGQWGFELRNGFNLCLYGYGSKRGVMDAFAQHLHDSVSPPPTIVVVNGYTPTITLSDILTSVASTLVPAHIKLPSLPATLLPLLLESLSSTPDHPIYILLNSIDATPLRRPATQSALATLAAHPSIHMAASADTPHFPLLWDVSLQRRFRFLFHDCTTFAPFATAAETDPVDSVNELLGRSGRRLGGRDGVGYVLRSLPANARHLFRILVAAQMESADERDDDNDDADLGGAKAGGGTMGRGVEYRVLWLRAREELVCSTEHQLRTLLKEFYDHQMVESGRDGVGAEWLLVPFRRDELDGLLEELVEEG